MNNIYCGVQKVPKGKHLGTAKQCAKARQIRYYGLSKVNRKILEEEVDEEELLQKEELKRLKLGHQAKKLIKEYKSNELKKELAEESGNKRNYREANKRLGELDIQKRKLIKQIKQQNKVITNLEKKLKL